MDVIRVKGLEVFANHGVFEEENVLGQKFIVNLDMYVSTRAAGINDDIKQSVDYGEVCKLVKDTMTRKNYKLIESVAEAIAAGILLKYPEIREVDVEVEKPWAPVMMPLNTVSVKINRKRHRAYLGIGSNIGDRESYLDMAIDELNNDLYTKVTQVSDFIETKPYGGVEQDDFLNGCVEIETLHTPEELLKLINDIEKAAGRERIIHWGPRTLDIDILLYDSIVYDDENLHIPHVEMTKRMFVLKPLKSIAGNVRHPLLNKTVNELYEELKEKEKLL